MEQVKLQFVRKTQDMATQFMKLLHDAEDIQAIWDSRLYGPGAANQFSDSELATLDTMGMRSCKSDDLYGFVIFCAQLQVFLKNGDPAIRDYVANFNHLRNDL